MSNPLLCSIIISSYNKMSYVGHTVESALSQTYPATEVIVVDDGSTDDSLQVLRPYADRVNLIEQANGGQAAALNRGFAASSGQIVFFLDCDDILCPDTVARTVAIWHSGLSKVHFRLNVIDGQGDLRPGSLMPPYRPLPSGDLSPMLYRFGFYPSPPTTGNAFARRYLLRVLPIPEHIYKAWPDTFLIGLAPLFGEIGTLDGVGGSWRRSGGENYSTGGLDKMLAKLSCDEEMIRAVHALATPGSLPKDFAARWPQHLKYRLLLARFGTAYSGDTATRTTLDFVRCALTWPEYGASRRIAFALWGVLVGTLPASLLKRIPGIGGPSVKLIRTEA